MMPVGIWLVFVIKEKIAGKLLGVFVMKEYEKLMTKDDQGYMWIPDSEFEYNISYIKDFLQGDTGLDLGCGCNPLITDKDCLHFDMSPQPKAVELVGGRFLQQDVSRLNRHVFSVKVDWIFSSHMLEDLPSVYDMANCLNDWSTLVKPGGYIVLLLPDIENGRYPTIAEGGNPSHKVDIGPKLFLEEVVPELIHLRVCQIDTIPREKSCTFDVVLQKL